MKQGWRQSHKMIKFAILSAEERYTTEHAEVSGVAECRQPENL